MTLARFLRRIGGASGIRLSAVVAVIAAAGLGAWLLGVASAGKNGTAVPASTVVFGSGTFQATFVRSASGIVNETNRVNLNGGAQNPWSPYDVWIQFRPLYSTPNPACDETGLVTDYSHDWSNHDPQLTTYFLSDTQNHYNVCVYLVTQEIASGTVPANDPSGVDVSLPVNGNYEIQVSGTWQNGSNPDNQFDAEYYSPDNWVDHYDGVASNPNGANQGDLMVDGNFVNWGAYNPSHTYSITLPLDGTVNLGVLDGNADGLYAPYYSDNVGSLSYTITYLQP